MKDHINWTKWASVAICAAVGTALLWLILRYALGVVLPFALAWLLSRLVRKPTAAIYRYTRIPRGIVAAVLVVALVGGAVWAILLAVRRGADELGRLVESLSTEPSELMTTLREVMGGVYSLSSHLPFLARFEGTPGFAEFCLRLDALAATSTERLVGALSARLPDLAMSVAGWLPSAFLFVAVTLLSCYYFTADDLLTGHIVRSLGRTVRRLLPNAVADRLPAWRSRLSHTLRGYLRAYLLLGLITFIEMFIGFSILGVSYAFLLALTVAAVDILPLLGTGVVLLPWAGVCFLTGDTHRAFGLLILYGVSLIVRQIAEPRLISTQLGLHPLLSLFCLYGGLRLFGLWGLLLAPVAAVLIRGLMDDPTPESAQTP